MTASDYGSVTTDQRPPFDRINKKDTYPIRNLSEIRSTEFILWLKQSQSSYNQKQKRLLIDYCGHNLSVA